MDLDDYIEYLFVTGEIDEVLSDGKKKASEDDEEDSEEKEEEDE